MPIRHALVVDDSKSARLMLRKMLQGLGVAVDVAESGEEALNYLRDRHTDAVFLDHIMPGMDGLDTLRKLKSDADTASIPVAMYTSRDDEPYCDEALAAGAIGVLTKPTMPEVLKALLERMHQAVDGSPRPVPKVSSTPVISTAPSTPANSTSTTPSLDVIERLIASKTESAFYEATETQVLPLINDVIAKLRKDIETNQRSIVQHLAEQICEERLAAWQPPLAPTSPEAWSEEELQTRISNALDKYLEAFQASAQLEDHIRRTATQICAEQEHGLAENVVQKLNAQFTDTIRRVATTVHDAAVSAAEQAVRQTINTQTADTDQHRQHMEALLADNAVQLRQQMQRLIYAMSTIAAALGMGAAALVYWLR